MLRFKQLWNYFLVVKILLNIFLCSTLFSQFDQLYNGFGVDIGTSGSGIFLTRQAIHDSKYFSLNGEIRLYDIKASDETIVYDYYSGHYQTVGGKSLFMLPFFFGSNYYLFNGSGTGKRPKSAQPRIIYLSIIY